MSSDESGSVGSIIKAGAEVASEVAKADQEQQKTYQVGLDLVRRAGTFLGGVFGPASLELGHMFGDQMRYWRFKNAVNILEKAQVLVEARGLCVEQIRALNFGEGVRLLEAASMEDDETVQEMWASLMANAVDPQSATKVEKVYIDILKSLSSREVVFLDLLARFERESGARPMTVTESSVYMKKMSALAEEKWRQFPTSDRATSIQNLIRLRCVTVGARPIDTTGLFAQLSDDNVGHGRHWAAVDPRKFDKVLREMNERQLAASGMMDFERGSASRLPIGARTFAGGTEPALPEAAFTLTALGNGLLRACQAREPR